MVYIKSFSHIYESKKTNLIASDLALESAKKSMEDISADSIDAVLVATITRDYVYPATACNLASKLNCHNAFAYDIEADFSGFLSALKVAYAFVESGRYNNILVSAVESTFICDGDDSFADGVVSALVTSQKSDISIDFIDYVSDGSKLNEFLIPMGGTVHPYTKEGIENKEHFIRINNKDIFEISAKEAGAYALEILNKNNINPSIIIPSLGGEKCYNAFVSSLGNFSDKVYSKMKDSKSAIGASSGINFSMALADGSTKKGDKIAVCSYGFGYSKSLAVFSYN